MNPMTLLALAAITGTTFFLAKGKNHPADSRLVTVRGKSGTIWQVRFDKAQGGNVFHTVLTQSGTPVVSYFSRAGVKNAPKFFIQASANVDQPIRAKAITDFALKSRQGGGF